MNILYLYAEVMGYTIATIRALVDRGAKVHVVHWDHKKLTPYASPEWQNVHMYKRSEMNVSAILSLAYELSPTITVISGWQDKDYMTVARKLRLQGKMVVTGLDDQWMGTLRQYAAVVLGAFGYFTRYYSHAWVSGIYQYEFARRLGFHKRAIVYDLYSSDLSLFHKAYQDTFEQKQKNYPHRFLFVGRFEPIKGLDILLQAWQLLSECHHDWELHLVGNGSLKRTLQAMPGVIVKDFMQPEKLMREVADAGCFLLPSSGEPWGVVVHEFSAAGMPLIVSDVVGAATIFLISGMNGYSFKVNDADALASCMQKIISLTDQELMAMGKASHQLSDRISPQTSAANLLAILNDGGLNG